MKRLWICMLLVAGLCSLSLAQSQSADYNSPDDSRLKEQYANLKLALNKLSKKLENVPVDIQRVAPLTWEYDKGRITRQGFSLVQNEIERTISRTGRINILDIEELQTEKVLKISGSDSSLKISNASDRASEKYDEKLMRMSNQYSIDAFLKGNIQYKDDVGFIILLEMINPKNKSVAWSTSVMSKSVEEEKEKIPGGMTNILSAGVTLLSPSFYQYAGNRYTNNINFIDYNASYTYRQAVDQRHSGYFGLMFGYHYYNLTYSSNGSGPDVEAYKVGLLESGLYFYKTLGRKSGTERQYWLEIFAGPHMLISFNNENIFGMAQGLHINVAKNLGVGLNFRYLFTGPPTLSNEDETKMVEANNTNYGINLLLKW